MKIFSVQMSCLAFISCVLVSVYGRSMSPRAKQADVCTGKLTKLKRCLNGEVFEEHTRMLPEDYCLKSNTEHTCKIQPKISGGKKSKGAELLFVVRTFDVAPKDSLTFTAEYPGQSTLQFGPYNATEHIGGSFSVLTGSKSVVVDMKTSSEEHDRLFWLGYTSGKSWTFNEDSGLFRSPYVHPQRKDPVEFTLNIKVKQQKTVRFKVVFTQISLNKDQDSLRILNSEKCDNTYGDGSSIKFPVNTIMLFKGQISIRLIMNPPFTDGQRVYTMEWAPADTSDKSGC